MCSEATEHFDAIGSQIFCPSKSSTRASCYGLNPDYALDFSCGWNLEDPIEEKKAFELQDQIRPYLAVYAAASWARLKSERGADVH